MPFIVTTEEICTNGSNINYKLPITYGVFSTEKKARDAIEIFVDKLTKRKINHNHDFAFDEDMIREEYRDLFLVIRVPEIDDDVMFRNHTPKVE